ncbi:hypothetical protein [Frankia sp. R82]|uniref:hypothetical protein n=1 Tax=Frankia sp. R82 TaxID=2950553 RepID=UPI002043A186|nr:hypothetical protein [Frankia sp. R82]MCM3885648.1 hypothetical protein [Frankia sp. R82]
MSSEKVAFLRADVERLCAGLAELAPALRLRTLTELRAAVDEVTSPALAAAIAAAQEEGWGLRRIGAFVGLSHEHVRRTLAAVPPVVGE